MKASIATIREQVEECLDDWDEDIAFVEHHGKPMLAFCKPVRFPVSDDIACLDEMQDPAARVDESQPVGVVMSGRRRWQDDAGELYRAVVAARELEEMRKERELEDVRAEFRRDYLNAARDRVMVGHGMTGDRQWHRSGD